MNFGNVQGLKLSINCFADVKLKMTNSRRQFFAAVKNFKGYIVSLILGYFFENRNMNGFNANLLKRCDIFIFYL